MEHNSNDKYTSPFDDLEMIKIEKIEDPEIAAIANKGTEGYQRLYFGVCALAALGIGSCALLDGLSWYHHVGLTIPGLTLLQHVWQARKNEDEESKNDITQVEELEIVSSDIITDEKTSELVEFGKRAWQATKVAAALTSTVLIANIVPTVDLNAMCSLQTAGLVMAEAANIALLMENNPFSNMDSQDSKTLTKRSK